MTLSRDQEVWAMALWVENRHGGKGANFIETRIETLEQNNEPDGAAIWRRVAARYKELRAPIPIEGQGWTLVQ